MPRPGSWMPSPADRARAAALISLALTAVFVWALPTAAFAHTSLRFADPAPGSRVGRPPTQVQLRFVKQSVPDPRTNVTVVGPSGVDIAHGSPSVTGLGISQRVSPAREAGVYVVSYTVVSSDGHLLRGGYDFLLTAAATATATSSQAAGSAAWQWWLLGAAFFVIVVVGSFILQSRQRSALR